MKNKLNFQTYMETSMTESSLQELEEVTHLLSEGVSGCTLAQQVIRGQHLTGIVHKTLMSRRDVSIGGIQL